eukprot:TRINITY_DN2499_c4_g1_i1.p1 TRINITY_DN2499_c4_g1~~TRINITY_DN2499_c4_g1_i1.p1  ORF type:complete len:429 (+),score=126.00 TRINITY_DN2499_c4_g1_i1:88-1287(+)
MSDYDSDSYSENYSMDDFEKQSLSATPLPEEKKEEVSQPVEQKEPKNSKVPPLQEPESDTESDSPRPSSGASRNASRPVSAEPKREAKVEESPGAHSQPTPTKKRPPPQHPAFEHASEEELQQIRTLKTANEDLRQQLLHLNSQLDDALNKRGEKTVQITRIHRQAAGKDANGEINEVEKLHHEIEKMRKLNTKLHEKLRQSDAIGRLNELTNILGEKTREVEQAKEEHRSLENIAKHQQKKLAIVHDVEERIEAARYQHHTEMKELKDKISSLKQCKDSDDKVIKNQQQQINLLQMKIRAASNTKVNPKLQADLEQKYAERAHQVEKLRYKVNDLAKSNDAERRRIQAQMKGPSSELKALQNEVDRLKSELKAQDEADFIGSPPPNKRKANKSPTKMH